MSSPSVTPRGSAPGRPIPQARTVPLTRPVAELLPGLTVVLPCFNEAGNVADAVAMATEAGERCARRHEILVVDDGSTDETAAIAARIAESDDRVRLLLHARNRGYGDALRSGVSAATMPWLLLTDADLQFDLNELAGFLPDAPTSDLVMGWRIDRQDAWYRGLNAAGWNLLMRHMFDLPVRDVDCAFKLVRTDLARRVELTAAGAMISTELVVKCAAAGARIHERGVHHRPRIAGTSSGANPRVILRAFQELAELRHALHTPVMPGLPR